MVFNGKFKISVIITHLIYFGKRVKKALFLDRDGVINKDKGYVSKAEDFEFIDGVIQTLQEFSNRGYLLIIITNQSGIGRGYYSVEDFKKLNQYMLDELQKHLVHVDGVYFCPHDPILECDCRKPKPKMVLDAVREFGIELENSIFVGDKSSDMKCALNAGVGKMFFVGSDERFNCIEKLADLLRCEV